MFRSPGLFPVVVVVFHLVRDVFCILCDWAFDLSHLDFVLVHLFVGYCLVCLFVCSACLVFNVSYFIEKVLDVFYL